MPKGFHVVCLEPGAAYCGECKEAFYDILG